jgi:MFS transporter, FHS family, glucose/mannose:H+ symporter
VFLTRVNFFWGLGAVSCPQFVAIAVRPSTLRLLLLVLSVGALGVSVALAPLLRRKTPVQRDQQSDIQSRAKIDIPIFLLFSLLMFLYVGGETSVSGWITTYAYRFANLSPARASLYVSAFWLAIVLSRAAVPLLIGFASESTVLIGGVITAGTGIAILLFPHSAAMSLGSVVIAGLGCGPVFPLAIARLLARIGDSRHAGWIFAICGSGGAVLPWVMGILSTASGSLRTAFLVPLFAMGGVLLLALLDANLPLARQGDRAGTV